MGVLQVRQLAVPKYPIRPILEHLGVELPGRGGFSVKIRCPNPEHPDRTPSCSVMPERVYCFGCGLNEDAIGLLMLLEFLDFKAAKQLAEELTGGKPAERRDWRQLFA